MSDANKPYSISEDVRQRCKIVPYDDSQKKRFQPVHLEQFGFLRDQKSIDYTMFLLVGDELIEYMKPKEFSQELLRLMWQATLRNDVSVEVMILKKDYAKFELMLDEVRDKKIKRILELDPALDAKTLQVFGTLSSASQVVGRAAITKAIVDRAKIATRHLVDSQLDSHVALGTIARMITRDPTLYDHAASVAMFTHNLATFMETNFSKADLETIALSGLYHDVGKACVSNYLINKPQSFTAEEANEMRDHARLGHERLRQAVAQGAPIAPEILEVALQHHERFGGGGYPGKRKGRLEEETNGIHLFARIVGVVDVFSALLMDRNYKPAMESSKAITYMETNAVDHYDPDIFNTFKLNTEKSKAIFANRDKASKKPKISMISKEESFGEALIRRQKRKD